MLICGCAGIGRLASLRCWCLQWAYGFESRHPHQLERLLLQSLFFFVQHPLSLHPLTGDVAKSKILPEGFPVSAFVSPLCHFVTSPLAVETDFVRRSFHFAEGGSRFFFFSKKYFPE